MRLAQAPVYKHATLPASLPALMVVVGFLAGMPVAHADSLSPDLLDQCRKFGDCTWITGKLIPRGSNESPVPNMCKRYDATTGEEVEIWLARQKFHVFWNVDFWHRGKAMIWDSDWFLSCDR